MLAGLNEELAFPLLLPRPKIAQDGPSYAAIEGKVVWITGAGGSIGSELAKQIATCRPSKLVLIDISEYALYEIHATIANSLPDLELVAALSNVRDTLALDALAAETGPEIIFHAAALKHVPLLQSHHNLLEAMLTNLGGTHVVSDLAGVYDCPFVLVSTDKAVFPSSYMGCTKRLAEIVTGALAQGTGRTHQPKCMLQVRFGNVIGSSGSVIPLFRRQIAQGGPVTVTHPEMSRFMMTIKQAVSLVIEAANVHVTEKSSYRTYILDMGEPVLILDLAKDMIQMSGLRPDKDIKIEFTGIREGEKLHEALTYPWETLMQNLGAFSSYDVGLDLQDISHDALSILRTAQIRHPKGVLDKTSQLIQSQEDYRL